MQSNLHLFVPIFFPLNGSSVAEKCMKWSQIVFLTFFLDIPPPIPPTIDAFSQFYGSDFSRQHWVGHATWQLRTKLSNEHELVKDHTWPGHLQLSGSPDGLSSLRFSWRFPESFILFLFSLEIHFFSQPPFRRMLPPPCLSFLLQVVFGGPSYLQS